MTLGMAFPNEEQNLASHIEVKMITKSGKLKRIGNRILKSNDDFLELRIAEARIVFLLSDVEKKKDRKIVFADCRKVNEQYAWCCPYDFMITVYEPNIINFTKKQIEILLEHELRHCGVDNEGNEPSFYLVPHDIEEFNSIIERYGWDWQKEE